MYFFIFASCEPLKGFLSVLKKSTLQDLFTNLFASYFFFPLRKMDYRAYSIGPDHVNPPSHTHTHTPSNTPHLHLVWARLEKASENDVLQMICHTQIFPKVESNTVAQKVPGKKYW